MTAPSKQLCLITVNQVDLGIRLLSGVLRDTGHRVRLVNLATKEGKWLQQYPATVKEALKPLLADCDLVGVSTVDMFLHRAEDLVYWISKELGKPVLLGGNHVELNPEESARTPGVAAVCVGQAVHSIAALVENWGTAAALETPDFWFPMPDGGIKKNAVLPPLSTSSYATLPLPDYSYDDYWYLREEELIRMVPHTGPISIDQHQIGHPNTVVVSFSQGCCNHCDFCNVAALTMHYRRHGHPDTPWLRCKPLARIKAEFMEIKRHNPNMEFIVFMDNNLAAHPLATLEGLAGFMAEEIRLPFYCMASPNSINEQKLACLLKAGLRELNMGVETNAAMNRKFYGRDIKDEVVLQAASLIAKHAARIHPFYDFLIFNPGESEQEVMDTIALTRQFPLPYDLVTHHLTVAPILPLHATLLKEVGRVPRQKEKLYESNWHDADPREYLDEPAFFVNLLMEWMAGPHTREMIGRLPRRLRDLRAHSAGLIIAERNRGLAQSLDETTEADSLDWLLRNDVRSAMQEDKALLLAIHDVLPPVLYTNQIAGYRLDPGKECTEPSGGSL